MSNLSDAQRILLSSASQRECGSILPLPACIKAGGGTTKAVDALVTRGFVEEHETGDPAATRRVDGDLRLGLFITAAGLAAIGVAEPENGTADSQTGAVNRAPLPPPQRLARPPWSSTSSAALPARPCPS